MRPVVVLWPLVLTACPRSSSTPDEPPPPVTAPVCAPPLVAIDDPVRVPETAAALLDPDGSVENVSVTLRVIREAEADIVVDPVPPGTYLMWDINAHSTRGDWFPDSTTVELEHLTGAAPTITGDDNAPIIEVASRWDEAGSSRVLQVGAQPRDHDAVNVTYLCGRPGTDPMSLAEAGAMVDELDPGWLPPVVLTALSSREVYGATTGTYDGRDSYGVDVPPDDAWVDALRSSLLAAGYEEDADEIWYGETPTPAAMFWSADSGQNVSIALNPHLNLLDVTVEVSELD